jgi:aminopeptidase N
LISFNKRFGDYPYTELDIVPLRMENAGGIEYPGVIGINADIYGEDDALESVVAHEVGHQWFYNVIGNDQVNEPWLDEAMAQYLTGMYYLDHYGEIGWRYYRETWVSGWASIGFERIPISQPVRSYTPAEYTAIVYSRGPLFLAALGEEMGEQTFETCLRGYYQSNKWQIVTTQTFIKHFESCSASDLTELFQRVGLPLNPGSK